MADTTTPTADDCKSLLERIAIALEAVQEAQVFIVADLAQIKQTIGAS